MANRWIGYNWNADGYRVEVWDGSQQIHSYDAGNYKAESTTYVEPGSAEAVSLDQLGKWARQTALEIAEEYGVATKDVTHDTDMIVTDEDQEEDDEEV